MPIVWILVGGLMVLIGLVCVIGAAGGSESAGIQWAYIVSGPIGFGAAGVLGALITHFVAKSTPARVGAPLGCGCVGAIAAVLATVVFFAAIFPAL